MVYSPIFQSFYFHTKAKKIHCHRAGVSLWLAAGLKCGVECGMLNFLPIEMNAFLEDTLQICALAIYILTQYW